MVESMIAEFLNKGASQSRSGHWLDKEWECSPICILKLLNASMVVPHEEGYSSIGPEPASDWGVLDVYRSEKTPIMAF